MESGSCSLSFFSPHQNPAAGLCSCFVVIFASLRANVGGISSLPAQSRVVSGFLRPVPPTFLGGAAGDTGATSGGWGRFTGGKPGQRLQADHVLLEVQDRVPHQRHVVLAFLWRGRVPMRQEEGVRGLRFPFSCDNGTRCLIALPDDYRSTVLVGTATYCTLSPS